MKIINWIKNHKVTCLIIVVVLLFLTLFIKNDIDNLNKFIQNKNVKEEIITEIEEIEEDEEEAIPENAIFGFEGLGIYGTLEEYDELLENFNKIDALNYLIDEKLFEKLYKEEKSQFEEYADKTIEYLIDSYGSEVELLNVIKSLTNCNSIEEYKKELILSYYQNKAIEDCLKEEISSTSIEKYYKNYVYGDMRFSHILIIPDTSGDITQEKAISQAYEKAKMVINELENGADFAKLASKYSDDDSTKNEGGDLGYFNSFNDGSLYGVVDTLKSLKVSEYTLPLKTEYGYQIFIKTEEKAKPTLEEVKDEIIEALVNEELENSELDSKKILIQFRYYNGLIIYDEELMKLYNNYINE